MRIKNIELWSAFLVIGIVTAFYIQQTTQNGIPEAGGFLGHSLGIVGLILMIMTEILYSLRKKYQFARWGKLQHWLSFHIFTGITGPYLVLLHTSWKFNGIAGILTLLTIIIVISGFIGRYFYTSIPRSAEGIVMESEDVTTQINKTDLVISEAKGDSNFPSNELKDLYKHHDLLLKQRNNLARSRRLLALWHTFHVPIGVALFTLAIIHIAATLYFATFLH